MGDQWLTLTLRFEEARRLIYDSSFDGIASTTGGNFGFEAWREHEVVGRRGLRVHYLICREENVSLFREMIAI